MPLKSRDVQDIHIHKLTKVRFGQNYILKSSWSQSLGQISDKTAAFE